MNVQNSPESVSGLTSRIKGGLEQWFGDVWVEGELSNVRIMATSPHAYFTLKDAGAQLPCAFFGAARNGAARAVLRDGAKVRLRGAISVFPPRGAYQLIVRVAEPVGEGELMARFEALKRRLAAEGLFDQSAKRPLPLLPETIGVVTSPTGAAIRDFLNVTRRRFAPVRIVVAPARVQGDGAADEIVAALRLLSSLEKRPDVVVVARGGGSLEDLWCFNEESVARAVRQCPMPVVSAVGHEIDFTICDFAADIRAPTPSAAAELVVKNREDLVEGVNGLSRRLALAAKSALQRARSRVELCRRSRAMSDPASAVRERAQRVDLLAQRLEAAPRAAVAAAASRLATIPARLEGAASRALSARENRLGALRAKLEALDPSGVLRRGYALVRRADGSVASDAAAFTAGDVLRAEFRDGSLEAVVRDRA